MKPTQNNQNFWDKVTSNTWNLTPYPWRPGYFDIFFFIVPLLKIYYRRKKVRVLLVGATKELRNVLSLLHIHYDLIDSSENMIRLTTPVNDLSLGEIFIQDWFTKIPNPKKYDIIFGDLILNLLQKEEVSGLFHRYAEYLNKGGRFIFRTRIQTTITIEKATVLVQKQLERLAVASIYPTFANLQTINTLASGQSELLLSKFITSEQEIQKKELAKLILDKYLHSGLNYYIHSKNTLLDGADKKISITCESHPKEYLDSFVFIEYKV